MRDRILFVCHNLAAEGGGEAVAAWMLQALAAQWDVTVVSWVRPDFAGLNRMFGTALQPERFDLVLPTVLERWLVGCIPDHSNFQGPNYLLRIAKRVQGKFVARVACGGLECDLGDTGIQYIHYPYLHASGNPKRLTVPGDAPWRLRVQGLLDGRVRPWMLISGYSFDRARRLLTLTNSEWTRGQIRLHGGFDSEVLYPMAPGDFADVPWEDRQDGFVVIGRLCPHKRVDWIIGTLAEVRRTRPGISLHICGFALPENLEYQTQVQDQARQHGPWIQIHTDLPRAELLRLMAGQRYGIHATVDEHFGIAPAEMARSGCIPFVHSSGGQVEIVGRDPRLCFEAREDAVRKILLVMGDEAQQHELRAAVHAVSRQFAPEVFVARLQQRVRQFIAAESAERERAS